MECGMSLSPLGTMTNPVYRGIDQIPCPKAVLEAITVRTRDLGIIKVLV
jgi:hypothetical protein